MVVALAKYGVVPKSVYQSQFLLAIAVSSISCSINSCVRMRKLRGLSEDEASLQAKKEALLRGNFQLP